MKRAKKGRRTMANSKYPKLQKMNNYVVAGEDRISQLPDEILITILSLLSYLEVARTCVLSKRWKYLWTFGKCLHFDVPTHKLIAMKKEYSKKLVKLERPKYVSWVNRALQLHKDSHITEFMVSFPLDSDNSRDLDKWLIFVMGKRVERLEVDLNPGRILYSQRSTPLYTFSNEVYSIIKSPSGLSSIKSITELSFKFVNITGRVVEHFISNCPLLEHLCVWESELFVSLRVKGSSFCLRFLEISNCFKLEYLDIYAPNLSSFICIGVRERTRILVRHAPSLVDVNIGVCCCSVSYAVSAVSSYFSQLESLTLRTRFSWDLFGAPNTPELPNLKNLTLKLDANEQQSVLDWTSFIERCPLLERFTLQLSSFKRKRGYIRKPSKCVHKCVKVVEFVGNIDIELAMYFIQNAIALEKIIVDCRPEYLLPCVVFKENEWSMDLRKRVSELRTQLLLPRHGVDLVILPCIQQHPTSSSS